MGRGCYTIIKNHKLHNFCCKHVKYVHPKYVLEHDNITLFGITKTHAFFCVSDPKFNVYETKVRVYIHVVGSNVLFHTFLHLVRSVHLHHPLLRCPSADCDADLFPAPPRRRDRRPRGPQADLHQHDDAMRVHPHQPDAFPGAARPGHVRAVVVRPHSRAAHPGQGGHGRVQAARQDRDEGAVQARRQRRDGPHRDQDDQHRGAHVPAAEGVLPGGQLHLQHQAPEALHQVFHEDHHVDAQVRPHLGYRGEGKGIQRWKRSLDRQLFSFPSLPGTTPASLTTIPSGGTGSGRSDAATTRSPRTKKS